jgi:D-alanyl-D-alanine dipeptidase
MRQGFPAATARLPPGIRALLLQAFPEQELEPGINPAMTPERALVKIVVIVIAVAGLVWPALAQGLPGDFVFLRDVDPTIIQDIRYAGANNFTGRPIAGYDAAECVVKREVGVRLKAVQQELARQRLSLKMFDCYRPARAVADMVAWSRNGKETAAERRYNPAFSKADLFRLGYIATHSGHSTGAAVDLTLVDLGADNSRKFDPAKDYADCTAPAAARAPEGSVDMGTGYDCSDVKAHTAASSVTPAQRRWRSTLVAAMARQGFANYSKEWRHFSLPGAGGAAYDFPIVRAR